MNSPSPSAHGTGGDLFVSARRLGSSGRSAARSAVNAVRERRALAQIEAYCFFIGYGRSGSTLVGAMLNAHPEIVIGNELDAMYLFKLGLSRNTIFSLLLQQERRFAERGYEWTGYNYAIPGHFQGRFTRLRVIGDKKAARSTRRLRANPGLLDHVRHEVRVPIRAVHIVRNPFDNIATMALREPRFAQGQNLESAITSYQLLSSTVDDLRTRLDPEELFVLRYEDLVDSPGPHIVKLCKFLGLDSSPDYVAAIASVTRSASRSRDQIPWSDDARRRIDDLIAGSSVLYGYDFER